MPILSWLAGPAAAATIALPLALYAPDKPRAELEAAYPGDYHMVDGVRLRLRDTGPRDAPAVILLHGFCASLDTWEPWAKTLSTRYRVIRFDLPGFGLTGADPTGDYSDARETKILTDLMNELGVARANLVGNSMGGRIAWKFAAEHPDRVTRMVLVSPEGFGALPGDQGKTDARTEPNAAAPWPMRALEYLAPPRSVVKAGLSAAYANIESLSEATLTRYSDLLLAPGVRQAIVARWSQMRPRDPAPILASIKTPTLLLWGERDGVIPIDEADLFLRDLPHATLVRLPNLGHLPFEENPAASLAPLQRFLSGDTP
ncbi:pimeloyl-ACP methyl ester carboxylesterase [Rhodoblastus acidophilus]|uniref:alpha/beta fold hydrolase n=1 Tax=Rhodoblastus acidophilus TaxID=1074 RepID=UPI0022253693|nr:alpha/beta hydrolase [Rhodoblastus acidophilus]MCW2284411.1 pimeloyl-ACP methyl ester carboxylesterase [Rhodoblastus acidophilus]MCW2333258.1 pimeloyl-ACP methyl ester carboxylesterase [Rhodoblastus acidophilus]